MAVGGTQSQGPKVHIFLRSWDLMCRNVDEKAKSDWNMQCCLVQAIRSIINMRNLLMSLNMHIAVCYTSQDRTSLYCGATVM